MKNLIFSAWGVVCLLIAVMLAGCPPQGIVGTFAHSWGYNDGGYGEETHSTMIATPEGGTLVAVFEESTLSRISTQMRMLDQNGEEVWESEIAELVNAPLWDARLYGPIAGEYVLVGSGSIRDMDDVRHQVVAAARIYGEGAGAELTTYEYSQETNTVATAMRGSDFFAAWTVGHVAQSRELYYRLWEEDGTLLFHRNFADPSLSSRDPSIVGLPDGFLMTGTRTLAKGGSSGSGVYAIRIDNDGEVIWDQTIGEMDKQTSNRTTVAAPNGDFVIAATVREGSDSPNSIERTATVFRIDATGGLIWQRPVSERSTITAMAMAENGDILLAASKEVNVLGAVSHRILVVRLDSNGNLLWERLLGGNATDDPFEITEAADGGVVILANSRSFTDDEGDIYLVKLTADGQGTDIPVEYTGLLAK